MIQHRLERLQEEMQHATSSVLIFEVTDPLLRGVMITRVVVTKDLGIARIYYDVGSTGQKREVIQKGLDRARGFIRRRLASRLNLRAMPEIEFFYDDTKEEISRVESLFSKL